MSLNPEIPLLGMQIIPQKHPSVVAHVGGQGIMHKGQNQLGLSRCLSAGLAFEQGASGAPLGPECGLGSLSGEAAGRWVLTWGLQSAGPCTPG